MSAKRDADPYAMALVTVLILGLFTLVGYLVQLFVK